MLLYTLGLFVILGVAITERFGYGNVCRILITAVPVIGILLYGVGVEQHWATPQESYFLVGGLIPSSDAESWLSGAWRLLELNSLAAQDQIRPLNAALHAFRLFLMGDYQSSVMFAALVAGATSIFVAVIIRQSLGWIAAGIYFVVSLSLLRSHLPLAMNEIHGYIFGSLALGFLWLSATNRSILYFSLGVGLFSIALNCRTGPLFVLPGLLLWGGDCFFYKH